jgi:hypothetical protein
MVEPISVAEVSSSHYRDLDILSQIRPIARSLLNKTIKNNRADFENIEMQNIGLQQTVTNVNYLTR